MNTGNMRETYNYHRTYIILISNYGKIGSGRRCLLHVLEEDVDEKIVLFTEKTLKTCRQKKLIRDGIKKKASKFDKIILPEEIDETTGYHPTCYKCFCAVREKNKTVVAGCKIFYNSHFIHNMLYYVSTIRNYYLLFVLQQIPMYKRAQKRRM